MTPRTELSFRRKPEPIFSNMGSGFRRNDNHVTVMERR